MSNCQQVKRFKPGFQMPRIITIPLFSDFTQISIANAVANPKENLKANVLHCKDSKDTPQFLPFSLVLTSITQVSLQQEPIENTQRERERGKKTDKIKYCLVYQFSSNTNRSSPCLPLK